MYSGVLGSNAVLVQTYKSLYCEKGPEGRCKCKRYQVAALVGSCPPDILPNTQLSVDDIVRNMEQKK
jgi:hypothetical protein